MLHCENAGGGNKGSKVLQMQQAREGVETRSGATAVCLGLEGAARRSTSAARQQHRQAGRQAAGPGSETTITGTQDHRVCRQAGGPAPTLWSKSSPPRWVSPLVEMTCGVREAEEGVDWREERGVMR